MNRRQSRQRSTLERLLPFTTTLKDYQASYLSSDLLAGLTVAVVLIPQSIAYAMLTGLPPVYGLYAALIAPVIAALWGSLPQISTGPVAIMSLLVLTTLNNLADTGTQHYMELTFLLSAMVGALLLVVGLLRFGFIMSFISHSAIKGFTSAAALIITSTQLPHLLGIPVHRHEYVIETIYEIILAIPSLHLATFGIGLLAMVIIYSIRKINQNLPAGLIGLTVATLAMLVLGLDQDGVALVGPSAAGLPSFEVPVVTLRDLNDLMGPAIVIALVSFAETFSVGKEISAKTKQKVEVDQEFIGQGLANLVGAFFQCIPVSGSFARTAVNFSAGAKTAVSSVVSSLAVVVALLFLTPLLALIPKTALAALIITAVMTLFHPRQVLRLWRLNRHDGAVAITVFALSLLTKPDYSLLIGVVMSLMFFLWKTMHPRIVRETKDPELNMFVDADLHQKPGCPQILQLRIEDPIYFANAEYTIGHIHEAVYWQGSALKILLLDLQAVSFVDLTAIDELKELREGLEQKGVLLTFSDAHLPVRQDMERAGLTLLLKHDYLLDTKARVINRLIKDIDHTYCRDTCPHAVFHECPDLKGWRQP